MNTFGAPMERASDLLATKTLTISKLLALAPPGTLDPSPHLYDTTMYTLTGFMAASVVIHSLVKRVPSPKEIVVMAKSSQVDSISETVAALPKEEAVGDRQVK